MSIGLILGIVAGGIVLVIILCIVWWIISTYNILITKKSNIEDAFDSLNSLLKKRYQDISLCVDALNKTLDGEIKEELLDARNSAMASVSIEEQFDNEARLEKSITKLLFFVDDNKLAITENAALLCVELQKSQHFIDQARQFYNGLASAYNIKLSAFPGTMLQKSCKLNKVPLYTLDIKKD